MCVNDTTTCWQTVGENRSKFYFSPTVCQHVVVSFTHTNLSFANTSWPTLVWRVKAALLNVSGSKISYVELELFLLVAWQFTLAFYGNKIGQTEIKTTVSLSPWKQLLFEIYILKTYAVTEAHAVWLTAKQPTSFLWIPCTPWIEIFDLLTPSHYPYIHWCYVIITHLFRSGV